MARIFHSSLESYTSQRVKCTQTLQRVLRYRDVQRIWWKAGRGRGLEKNRRKMMKERGRTATRPLTQTNRTKWVRLMEQKIEESWASYLSTNHSQNSKTKREITGRKEMEWKKNGRAEKSSRVSIIFILPNHTPRPLLTVISFLKYFPSLAS